MCSQQVTDIPRIFLGSLSAVLETQAMVFADAVPAEEIAAVEGPVVAATICFSGHARGRVGLFATEEFCRELAANVLGGDPEDEAVMAAARDCLQELLNVLAGQFLTGIFGTGPVFSLSIPTSAQVTDEAWAAAATAPQSVTVLADDHPLIATVAIEGSVP